jgi:molybdate transport system regulatory protein
MEPRVKLWIEDEGRMVLGSYRVRLLQLIGETGSLSEAASQLGLSYRRAWGKVRQMETNLGVSLIESTHGGAGGGSSTLTPDGARLVEVYEEFRALAERAVSDAFAQAFGTARGRRSRKAR